MGAGLRGRGRRGALLLSLALLAARCAALSASSVAEEASIASLREQVTWVNISLSQADAAAFSDADLESRCRAVAGAASCSHVRGPGAGEVSFRLAGAPALSVRSLSRYEDGERSLLRARLGFEHRPFQFALAPGLLARRRGLTLRFPSYSAVIADVQDQPAAATFAVTGEGGGLALPARVAERARSLAVGEVLEVPRLQGSSAGALCLGAVLAEGQERPASSAVSLGCEPFALPAPSLAAGAKARLVLAAVDVAGVVPRLEYVDTQLSLARPALAVSVSAPNGTVAGPSFDVEVAADGPVDGCEVSLVDMDGNRLELVRLASCGRVRLGTARLDAGRYIVRARVTRGALEGSGSAPVVVGPGRAAGDVELYTEKEVYALGEDVALSVQADGEACESALSDIDGAEVATTGPGPCGPATLELGTGLEAGRYELSTEVLQGGTVVATAARTLDLVEDQAPAAGAAGALCAGGSLPVPGASIPCIGPRATCRPTSAAFPLCLCFDAEGVPRGVCEHLETCAPPSDGSGAGACEMAPASASPFTVVRGGGACLARRGLETLACTEVGEVCAGTCVCLDPSDRPLSPCSAGQVCTLAGCTSPAFVFEVKELSPAHVRAGEAGGAVELTWRGAVRSGGRTDDPRIRERLEAAAFLGRTAAARTDASFDAASGEWTFRSAFERALAPGRYEAFLQLAVDEDQQLVRRPFEVWYPQDRSELAVEVVSAAPARVSRSAVAQGATVRLVARIADAFGSTVTYLPATAMSARLGDGAVRADVTAADLDEATGLWTVVLFLHGTAPSPTDGLALEVGHLGRSGRASARVSVMERVPLALRIVRVEPGTGDEPLFLLMAGLGFDMDVLMELEGDEGVSKEDIAVRLGGRDVSASVAYVYRTSAGVRLHLSGVRLCPMPSSAMPLDVQVTVSDAPAGDSATDTARVQLSGNPGNWRDLEGVAC